MIVSGPGVEGRGIVDERPAELVDVVPTLLQAAGVEIPETLPGVSLLSDFTRVGSFAEMHGRGYEEDQRAPAVMWRAGGWKLILHLPGKLGEACHHYDTIPGELYDLADDPLEMNNRYADAACAGVRERMTAQVLMHVMSSLGKYPHAPARTRIRVTGPETKPDASMWPIQ
jgi:arylsulfatase A-like enzyme